MGFILRMQRYEFLGNLPNFIVLFFRKPLIFRNFVAYLFTFVTARLAFSAASLSHGFRSLSRWNEVLFLTIMQTKTRAIVLHCLKYGESQYIVDMFTEAMGRVAFIQTVRPTGRGKIRKQLFQPLSILDIEYDHRQRVSLQRLKEARLLVPYASIPFDAYKLSLTIFVSEFLLHVTRNETQNAPLFDYVVASLMWLDGCCRGFANFHLVFMLRLSLFVGFYPNLEAEDGERWFDLRAACFVPGRPPHPDFLVPDDAARLRLLMRMTFDNMHLFAMSRVERNRCVDLILKYYALHMPDFPEMRSLDVMKSLFV